MRPAPAASATHSAGNTTPTPASPATRTAGRSPVSNMDANPQSSPDAKLKKKGLFGFGKKKADTSTSPPATISRDLSQSSSTQAVPSPAPIAAPQRTASSPNRATNPSSPRLISPAGSQIFERNVQDDAILPNSVAIPAHIQTENHIPAVLDASSEAITDDHLDPDTVEIVTHASHQPAAAAVAGASMPASQDNLPAPWAEDLAAFSDREDIASNYGSLDSSDIRRLSFISFADVVQSEHGGLGGPGNRESVHLAGLTSLALGANRSPSPIRSPVSSQGPETSPPNSKSGSVKGLSMSPVRQPLGSPGSADHSIVGGELNIETMTQALRRTGSTDLSQARSISISPLDSPSR